MTDLNVVITDEEDFFVQPLLEDIEIELPATSVYTIIVGDSVFGDVAVAIASAAAAAASAAASLGSSQSAEDHETAAEAAAAAAEASGAGMAAIAAAAAASATASAGSATASAGSATASDASADAAAASAAAAAAVATDFPASVATLTNKTIAAADNTITGLGGGNLAANVLDTDNLLAANSDARWPSQRALRTYIDGVEDLSGDINVSNSGQLETVLERIRKPFCNILMDDGAYLLAGQTACRVPFTLKPALYDGAGVFGNVTLDASLLLEGGGPVYLQGINFLGQSGPSASVLAYNSQVFMDDCNYTWQTGATGGLLFSNNSSVFIRSEDRDTIVNAAASTTALLIRALYYSFLYIAPPATHRCLISSGSAGQIVQIAASGAYFDNVDIVGPVKGSGTCLSAIRNSLILCHRLSTPPAWVTATVYAVENRVTTNNLTYKCLIAHTSGTFATDLAAGKWVLIAGTANIGFRQAALGLSLTHQSKAHVSGLVNKFYFDDLTTGVLYDNPEDFTYDSATTEFSASPSVTNQMLRSPSLMMRGQEGVQVVTDASVTLAPRSSRDAILFNGTLTATRAVTLSTTGVRSGDTFMISRAAAGAFSLNVGTGPLKALAAGTWCEVTYSGTAWYLSAYGAL